MRRFEPNTLPLLIGSLPIVDHREALLWIFESTPEIPLWVQLPKNKGEGMISQFLPGMPGYIQEDSREYIDYPGEEFDVSMLHFFEEYLAIQENASLENSRFSLDKERARGFYEFISYLKEISDVQKQRILAVKGQITGPITFATAVKDREGKSIFYEPQLREIAVKHLSMQSVYQAERLNEFNFPVIIFLDEPALAGFGSSEFISISKEDVLSCFSEIIEPLHLRDVLVGIHICANTDWSLVFDSKADILSFDAYSYFDKLILFKKSLRSFLERGGMLAWGIVPTEEKLIGDENLDSLKKKYHEQLDILAKELDMGKEDIEKRLFITPSCGTGSLSPPMARKVLSLTRGLYERLQK